MKFSQMLPPQQQAATAHIDSRFKDLLALTKESTDSVLKQLFLINAGAAVAVLSFMGAYPKAAQQPGPMGALAMFLFGLVCVLITSAIRYHFFVHIMLACRRDAHAFYNDELVFQEVLQRDTQRVDSVGVNVAMHLFGYASLAFFLVGCGGGALHMMSCSS